ADHVVMDIPTGPGTKIKNVQEGRKLARDLINLGDRLGMDVDCALTYGASPVGRTIGPALEVIEALKVLESFDGPNSLIEKSASLAGMLLEMGNVAAKDQGYDLAIETLKNGKALAKFKEIIKIQGGNPDVTHKDISVGEFTEDIIAPNNGYILEMDNKRLVQIARLAGAPNDKGAGILLHKKHGEPLKEGETMMTIYAEKKSKLENAAKSAKERPPFIVEGMMLERIQSFKEI
ncbi:MAG: thymidine phosphorylase, partial [Methanococcoides sp.]|nr:thymidine phosphorylase [Methanococcoides sp.]